MENHKYAVVDIETTGHSSTSGDRIIQLAIVFIENGNIVDTFTTFINPKKPIPFFIQDLTKIKDKDVQHAPLFETIGSKVLDLLQDHIFVAHNIHFDLPFLQKELQRVGLPKLVCKTMDTVEFAKLMFPNLYSYKLQDIATELHIPLEAAHRADDDALATAYLLLKCIERLESLPIKTIELLHKRSFQLKSNLSILFFDVLAEKRKQYDATNYLMYRGIPLKEVEKEHIASHISIPFPRTKELKIDLFQKGLSRFEERQGQFAFMDEIQHALDNKTETVCEAETGIGKTLGYLLPATIYGLSHQKPVIISTYTTHLIDQLVLEEIPKLTSILGTPIRVAKLKGMQHYIDLYRFWQHVQLDDESYDETFTIMQILVWLTLTDEGDLTELNVSGGGQLFVDKIRKTSLSKVLEERELDFYERALRKSEKCDILVTNHAMIMADREREKKLLAHGCATIIDEAHQVIHASMSRKERVFSYTTWKYVLGQFGTLDTDQLLSRLALLHIPLALRIRLEKQYVDVVETFDQAISSITDAIPPTNSYSKSTKRTAILEDLNLDTSIFRAVATAMQTYIFSAKSILATYAKNKLDDQAIVLLNEWEYWIRELEIKVSEWDEIFLIDEAVEAKWLEIDTRSIPGSLTIIKRPLNYQKDIKEAVDPLRLSGAVIWTSGTLTVPSNRHFITSQLGLSTNIPIQQYRAAADYYNGAELLIMEDMPDIKQVSQSDYIEAVAEAIVQTVLITEGRCFVLFTSQDMLRKTVEIIQDTNLLEDYMLFAQGMTSGSRMRLLKSFQRFSKSVLFGTNSFWEGVDVPGDALSVIIMVRLPFSSPDDPLYKKRAELLSVNGQNPFTAYSLPEAVLRFRQGFGRLIRSSNDKGVFIVLDRRIETKSYGSDFLQAIPNIPVKKVTLENMVLELENWYTNEG
ncbi:ATP-dependent DNA helicase DinG [Psychrobacillus sp. NEAU-3TGS]|uniref:ATP-dependent DNA helicase DinG n=1 Tax=Psychrobacillus sp. NEAU-3TGS TaxID=2995412 RepID=UPI00249873B8|nr:ATP-dependent DNA helicase DinG [Psychrobacillus sp. NEAU-3TGS]MDI2589567.1 ATP-dependent DNA helicase DinG [Psychrobacillus sp. NEAU-3TGS]